MTIAELSEELSAVMGEDLAWGDNALVVTMADGKTIGMDYLDATGELYLHGNVGGVRSADFERVSLTLLKANLFGAETGGSAVIAYDDEEKSFVIWDKLRLAECSFDAFFERFSQQYLAMVHWTNTLAGMTSRAAPSDNARHFGMMA